MDDRNLETPQTIITRLRESKKRMMQSENDKGVIQESRAMLYLLGQNVERLHYGCAYCGSQEIKTTRLLNSDVSTDEKYIYVVVDCASCENEDWIMVPTARLARIAMFL
jgi:hypothetical protein